MLSVKLFIVHPLPKLMPFKQHSQTLWRRGRFPCAICYDFAGFCVVSANILIGIGLCTLNRFHSGNVKNRCSRNDNPMSGTKPLERRQSGYCPPWWSTSTLRFLVTSSPAYQFTTWWIKSKNRAVTKLLWLRSSRSQRSEERPTFCNGH